jgi:hypothetical protein
MSAEVVLRCRTCRKGFLVLSQPILRCPVCDTNAWVNIRRFTLLDRWRLWWQTGKAPWTSPQPM